VTCDRLAVFSRYSGSSINKTDHHDITEILLKVALTTITPTLTLKKKMARIISFCNFRAAVNEYMDFI
jgi:hypothetical protein